MMGSVSGRWCQGLTVSLLYRPAACKLSELPLARALGKAVHPGAGGAAVKSERERDVCLALCTVTRLPLLETG